MGKKVGKKLSKGNNSKDIRAMTCWYTNADVLSTKLIELRFRLRHCISKPLLLFICEVNPKNLRYPLTAEEMSISGYKLYLKRENRGIAIYVHESISAWQVEMNTEFEEALWIRMRVNKNEEALMGCLYRSPHSSKENNDKLRQLLVEVNSGRDTHVFMVGDFNYPKIDWENWTTEGGSTETEEYKFIEAVRNSYMYQHVSQATRGRGMVSTSLLDLIMTREEGIISNIEYESPLGKSDHCVLIIDLKFFNSVPQRSYEKFYYDKGDYEAMRTFLGSIEWEEGFKHCKDNVEEQLKMITENLQLAKQKFIPSKIIDTAGQRQYNTPLDMKTRQAVRKKHRTWQRYIETMDQQKYKEYARARNKAKSMTRKLQRAAEREISLSVRENPKNFWKYVKSKVKVKEGVADLYISESGDREELTKTDGEKAQVLADFFSSVFIEELDSVPPPIATRNYGSRLEMVEITAHEIKEKLKNLKVDKSPGPDEIQPRILKELSSELAEPLKSLYNTSLRTGKVPEIWRQATISAIFKKGCKKTPSNYRPVSLTCILSKVMESIVRDKMVHHMSANNLFSQSQFGFISGRSITLQLLKVMDTWTEILEGGGELDVVYLDIKKAFDTVPHNRLMMKLKAYGMGDQLVYWIKALLNRRKQKVVVRGSSSEWKDVVSGVPQGSVIGPLLFVIYINDLPDNIESSVYMFADDTKCFKEIGSSGDQGSLQRDLDRLQSWSVDWLLEFHPAKCKVMTVTRQRNQQVEREYFMQKEDQPVSLERVDSEKDLGIIVDQHLTFEQHINDKINKANRTMGLIRRSFVDLNKENFIRLYKALVRPQLEFGNVIWSPSRKKDITSLENVQRRSTRMVNGLRHLSYQERLKELSLPTLVYRRLRGEMIETYKIARGKYDTRVAPVLDYNVREELVTRGHQYKLNKKRCNTRIRQNSYMNRIVNVWNSLPSSVVEAPSIYTFEKRLDRHWQHQEVFFNYEAKLSVSPQMSIP